MRILISIILILFSAQASAEIYKWTDQNGKVHFSDKPQEGAVQNTEKVEIKVNTYTNVTFDVSSTITPKVVMYSTAWCGYCKKARQYFRKNNIAFNEYDIEKSKKAKRRYDKLGGNGVPVILYNGKRMNGFSEKSFLRIYKSG